jgi:predicted SAM-dependent methyltransferase
MENKKIKIDIGCGKNKREGFTGVDIDPSSGADVIASAMELPYEDNSVDELYSAHLVEHFDQEETKKFFKEIFRVLKPGAVASLKVDRDWSKKRLMGKDSTHKHRYTAKELNGLLEGIGFSKALAENKIYFLKLWSPRNKIFVRLEK